MFSITRITRKTGRSGPARQPGALSSGTAGSRWFTAGNYDYYAFPGGGIDRDESGKDALIREVREETGLEVIPDSIKEYGLIVRKEKGAIDDLFIQENYYYLCDVSDHMHQQELSGYEIDEDYELCWMDPEAAVRANLEHPHGKLSGEEWAGHLFRRVEALIGKLKAEGLL